MLRRSLLLAGALCLLAIAGATQALAHVSLDKSSVPADSDQSLQVRVPGENPPAYNVKLILEVPAGFVVKSCDDKVGWTCNVKPDTSNGRSAVVTWTRSSGVDAIDLFDLQVHTPDRNGNYPFEANQYYSDGKEAHWDGPAGSDNPAPVLEVTGATTAPVQNTAPPAAHGSPTGAPTSAPRPAPHASTSAKPANPASPIATTTSVAGGPTGAPAPTSSDGSSSSPSAAAITAADPVSTSGDDSLPTLVVVGAVLAAAAMGGTLLTLRFRRR